MRSTGVVVNTRHSRTVESTQSPRDQLSKVHPCLANVHSAAENTACLVHIRSTCKLHARVWTLSSRPPYNLSTLNTAYCTTPTRAGARILNINPIWALLDRSLPKFVETFHTSLILKYSRTLRQPLLENRLVMKAPRSNRRCPRVRGRTQQPVRGPMSTI